MKRTLAISPECKIVFATANGENDDAMIRSVADSGRVDWVRVNELAAVHKAAAALSRTLDRTALVVPQAVRESLQRQRMVNDFHMRYLQSRLKETLGFLEKHSVQVMLLKGSAMGATVYDSFEQRPMADIDLLVRPGDAIRARNALLQVGWRLRNHAEKAAFYSGHHHLEPLEDGSGSGHTLELHVAAFRPPSPFGDVENELWEDACPTPHEYHQAVVPSREHLFVYACIHLAWSHMMARGAWRTFRDLNALSHQGLRWDRVRDVASRWRAVTACFWTMRLASTLTNFPLPRSFEATFRIPGGAYAARVLERHFLSELVPGERPACPSAMASSLMWRAGIRPRWSGHGSSLPLHAGSWSASDGIAPASAVRFPRHVVAAKQWSQYLLSLALPTR